MKSINLVVSKEFIINLLKNVRAEEKYKEFVKKTKSKLYRRRIIKKKLTNNLGSMLYYVFVDRGLDYGEDFMERLIKEAGFGPNDNLNQIFLSFRISRKSASEGAGKYVAYYIHSSKEIHGNCKKDTNKETIGKLASMHHTYNYDKPNLFVTDQEAGKVLEPWLKTLDEKVEIKRV